MYISVLLCSIVYIATFKYTLQEQDRVAPFELDPSQCNSTNMQKSPNQTQLPLLLNQYCNFKILQPLERRKALQHSQLYDWLHFLSPFELGDAMKAAEERCYRLTERITMVFVKQPLALAGSLTKCMHYIALLFLSFILDHSIDCIMMIKYRWCFIN